MPLDIARPRKIFEKNPLKVVVLQVRFPPIFSLENPAGVAPFQEAIRAEYPVAQTRPHDVAVSVGETGMGMSAAQGPWRFVSEDSNWVAAVATDFISLEAANYERFEGFADRAERLLDVAWQVLKIPRRNRLGLRYVNEIRHPNAVTVADWRQFVLADVIGIAGGSELSEHVTQSLQQIQAEFDEGKLTIRNGYVREDDGGSVYILDLDAFDDVPRTFDVREVVERVALYKKWVWAFFSSSISDELESYLGPRDIHE